MKRTLTITAIGCIGLILWAIVYYGLPYVWGMIWG